MESKIKWPQSGEFNPPLKVNDGGDFNIQLSSNLLSFSASSSKWHDITPTGSKESAEDPLITQNICLKKRVEALKRTAAISYIEVQQLEAAIKEGESIISAINDEL